MGSSRRAFERNHLLLLVLSDAAACVLAVLTAYLLRAYTPELLRPQLKHSLLMYLRTLPAILPLWLVTFESLGLYRVSRAVPPLHDLTDSLRAVTLATLLIAAVSFLSHTDYSRGMLVLFWILALGYVSLGRTLLSDRRARALATGAARSRALVLGCGELGRLVLQRTREHPEFGYEVVGFVSANGDVGPIDDVPVMTPLAGLPSCVTEQQIDQVIVAHPGLATPTLMDVIQSCEGLPVEFHVISGPFGVLTGQAQVSSLTDLPTIELPHPSFSLWKEALKRIGDVLGALLLLILLAPLALVLIVLIRRQTGASALFRQERIGRSGRPFTLLKFRSMRPDADPYAEAPRRDDDPRVTPIGRWLRRYSLDELPQLWNVIRGEMSLVGPRPEMPFIVAQYEPWQRRRLEAKPGLTGLWQILGRKDLPLRENIEYDFYYIRNQSLTLDLVIVLKTVGVVLRGRGAY
ncbi:MAG: sugar transferase [Armatimonadetes bacterium]|nr:sugar transferase [Armatimonadota bacterium]